MTRYRVPQSLTEAIYRKNQEQIDGFIEHKMGLNEARAKHSKDKGLPTLPLVQAVRQGDADLVCRLIGAGADPDGAPYLETPMSVAIQTGNTEVLDALHEGGASMKDLRTSRGLYSSYMVQACTAASEQVVAWLIERGADAREIYQDGYTLVHAVMENYHGGKNATHGSRDKEKLRLLVEHGADLLRGGRRKGADGCMDYPFVRAVAAGDAEVVGWFLKAGADPNAICEHSMNVEGNMLPEGLPMLAYAILGHGPDRAGVARALIDAGADTSTRLDFNTKSPGSLCRIHQGSEVGGNDGVGKVINGNYLMLACAWSDIDCVKVLLEAGMDVNAVSDDGATPVLAFMRRLTATRRNLDFGVLGLLLQSGANPNHTDAGANTALHLFARVCDQMATDGSTQEEEAAALRVARALVEMGCCVHARNDKGLTAADECRQDKNAVAGFLRAMEDSLRLQAHTPGGGTPGGSGPRF